MFLIIALILWLVLPSPWDLICGLGGLAIFACELVYWQRRMRHTKVATGVENLVGAIGVVTETCAPVGQVRVGGEIWGARSFTDAERGTSVRVVRVDGLSLEVEPVDGDAPRASS